MKCKECACIIPALSWYYKTNKGNWCRDCLDSKCSTIGGRMTMEYPPEWSRIQCLRYRDYGLKPIEE